MDVTRLSLSQCNNDQSFFPLIGIPISIMIFSCNFFTGTKISNRFDFIQTNTEILQFQVTFSIRLLF